MSDGEVGPGARDLEKKTIPERELDVELDSWCDVVDADGRGECMRRER